MMAACSALEGPAPSRCTLQFSAFLAFTAVNTSSPQAGDEPPGTRAQSGTRGKVRLLLTIACVVVGCAQHGKILGRACSITNQWRSPRKARGILIGRLGRCAGQAALARRAQHIAVNDADTASGKDFLSDDRAPAPLGEEVAQLLEEQRAARESLALFVGRLSACSRGAPREQAPQQGVAEDGGAQA